MRRTYVIILSTYVVIIVLNDCSTTVRVLVAHDTAPVLRPCLPRLQAVAVPVRIRQDVTALTAACLDDGVCDALRHGYVHLR